MAKQDKRKKISNTTIKELPIEIQKDKTNVSRRPVKVMPFKINPKNLNERRAIKANKKAFESSSEQARLEGIQNNFNEVGNSFLWNLPGSISPMAAEDLLIGGIGKGVKYLKGTKVGNNLVNKAGKFVSGIDWGKWNKEIPNNTQLMKEYNTIEETTKANGTWMKNFDGTEFKGTPEQFVQQNSDNFKKAFPNPIKDSQGIIQKNYHGSPNKFKEFKDSTNPSDKTGERLGKGIYTTPKRQMALEYAFKNKDKKGNLYELYQNSNNPQNTIENFEKLQDLKISKIQKILQNKKSSKKQILQADKDFNDVINNQEAFYDNLTDADFKLQKGKDFFKINNEQVVPFTNYPKSMVGNNGIFDMTNPNIYKALAAPVGLGTVLANNKAYGGSLNNNTNNDTTMRKKVKIKSKDTNPPKHFWGALIGTGVSVATSLIGANQEKKLAKEQAKQNYAAGREGVVEADRLALEDYPEEGLGTVNYYQAKGGKLATPMSYKTRGGDLEPISSDMDVAKGNKHNENTIDSTSGIKLNNGKKDIAEIEDGETVKDNRKVYSDRSIAYGNKTYADVAKDLSTEKGKLEEDLLTTDKITMQTKRRKIKAIDQKEDALFAKQEMEKGNEPTGEVPKGYGGLDLEDTAGNQEYKDNLLGGFGDWRAKDASKQANSASMTNITPRFADTGVGKGVTAALPLVDNIANAIITKNAPKIPKPVYSKHRDLETTVNVNPQLANVQDTVDSVSRNIAQNTSSSAVARNAISSAKLQGSKQANQLLTQKETQEQALRNANVQTRGQVTDMNLAKQNKFNTDTMARRDALQQRTSANFANIAGDLIDNRNYAATEAYNKERLDIAREVGDVEGTSLRSDLSNPTEISKLLSDKRYAQEQLNRYKDSPKELAQLKAILGIN